MVCWLRTCASVVEHVDNEWWVSLLFTLPCGWVLDPLRPSFTPSHALPQTTVNTIRQLREPNKLALSPLPRQRRQLSVVKEILPLNVVVVSVSDKWHVPRLSPYLLMMPVSFATVLIFWIIFPYPQWQRWCHAFCLSDGLVSCYIEMFSQEKVKRSSNYCWYGFTT